MHHEVFIKSNTLKTEKLTKGTSSQTGFFQQNVVTVQKKMSLKHNEWTETNEIVYAYTEEVWELFRLFSGCYDNVKGK